MVGRSIRVSACAFAAGVGLLTPVVSAQIVVYQQSIPWMDAASQLGQVQCKDVEGDTPGSYPSPYITSGGWAFGGNGVPAPILIIVGSPLNPTTQVAFRDPGGGIRMDPHCDPLVAFSFKYFSQDPWSITIDGQNFPLNPGSPGFFGATSNGPINSIVFNGIPGGQAMLFLDDLCCVAEGSGPQLGACCYIDSQGIPTCSIVSAQECAALGGTFHGVNSTCTPNLCAPEPFGACCFMGPAGPTCSVVTPSECANLQGTYFGDGSTCDPSPCPSTGQCQVAAGDCCAGRPDINDPLYQGFPTLVTVGTASRVAQGTAVVTIFGLNNPNGGPFNTDFGAPMYSHPSWSETNLGSVFGVALDPAGNIYVTGTTCYGQFATAPGTLGANFGVVYKLDTNTGVASVFATLPNSNNTGLGNITFDCAHNQFFVSNMEDGKIYRLDMTGTVLNSFDFGAPDNPANTFPPLGDRVWGVEVHNNRVYFGVWFEDSGNPSATAANQIWSIALDGTGNFTGAAQLEVQMPPNQGSNYSNPISDLRFTPSGTMLVAERGMNSATEPVPHDSRLLEFNCVQGSWVLSGNNFLIGIGAGNNTAGGVDMDYSTGGRVYATGDALQLGPQAVYGTQGLPATGGDVTNSVLIDFNGVLNVQDKTQIGSVAVPCPGAPCLNVSNQKIFCPTSSNPCFTWQFMITNKSGFSVKYVTIPLHPTPNSPITINPNIINLLTQDGSLLDDGESTMITLTVCNANPGDEFCLTLGLVTPNFVTCCFEEVCITLPACDCGQLRNQMINQINCAPGGTVSFSYSFTLDNYAGFPANWAIFVPFKDEQATFVKDFFFLPPLVPGGSYPMKVDITNAVPGETFCFWVLLQHPSDSEDDCCCAFEKCIEVPPCDQVPNTNCGGDANGDGAVDVNDLLAVINSWGPCPTGCPPGCPADVTNDCVVSVNDLLVVINAWGPCPK